jgi:alkanesulfonate monooxygenase SsuD/methylene tetrahydromethanopterin reductase-like flavin-dependent oxidoreductase (luciferase family)
MTDERDIEEFVDAYIEAMLWATNDESDDAGGEPLDANYDKYDLAPAALEAIVDDCRRFLDDPETVVAIANDWTRAGHDFFLTRHGHGSGFWDGDWPEESEKVLMARTRLFGETWACVGDDGMIYVSG